MTIPMQERFVVSEESIFKYLVFRDDASPEDIRQNMHTFLRRIPQNIFINEYHVLYECVQKADKFGVVLTYDQLHQILLNNMQAIVTSPHIHLFTDEQTQVERESYILDYILATFDDISLTELEEENTLQATMEFYLETWGKNKMEEIIHKQLEIIDGGLTIGRRRYYGVEDAKAYYDNAFSIIRSLLEGDGDFISESIDTSTMTAEQISELMTEEATSEVISHTGIAELDSRYDYRKGDIVTIQAGTGVGKTRFANGMVYNTLSRGKNTLYLTFEQKTSRVMALQQSRHYLQRHGFNIEVSDRSILRRTFPTDCARNVDDVLNDFVSNDQMGRIRIEGINLNASEVRSKLLNVWESGFHFDEVVIDYLGLLMTNGSSRYEALTNVINELKSDVKSFKGVGFLLIVLNQLTKEAEQKIAAGNFDSGKAEGSETQYLVRASDYQYTLIQTDDDKLANKMTILIDKVRLGDKHASKVQALAFLGQCYFADYEVGGRPVS